MSLVAGLFKIEWAGRKHESARKIKLWVHPIKEGLQVDN